MLRIPIEAIVMKSAACLFALSALIALPVGAQSAGSSAPPKFAPTPPPPGMNDPGVNPSREPAVSSTSANAPASSPAEITPSQLPGKPIPMPKMPGAQPDTDANGNTPPNVTVHQEGENTIEEYRQNGTLYMVVVHPPHGLTQTYMIDKDGHMTDPHGAPPVKPVMYKVLEWGGKKPASSSSTGDSGS